MSVLVLNMKCEQGLWWQSTAFEKTFEGKKCKSNWQPLLKKPIIASKRKKYSKANMEYRNLPEELLQNRKRFNIRWDPYPFVLQNKEMLADNWTESVTEDISTAKRWILIHASTENVYQMLF